MSLTESPPVHSVYRGSDELGMHSLSRGFNAFGHHMRRVFSDAPQLDPLIKKRIQQAGPGEDVVVLDLGGGVGNFSRDFLTDPVLGKVSRRSLAARRVASTLRFYSVTDARAAADHGRLTPFAEANRPGNEHITAHQVDYSLTSSQTIKRLLADHVQQPAADVVVASSFISYLHPALFERTVQDIIDVLKPGGTFMTFGYSTIPGRFLSVDDGYAPTDEPVAFTDPTQPGGPAVASDELRSAGEALLADPATTDVRLLAAIQEFSAIMYSAEYFSRQAEGTTYRDTIRMMLQHGLRKGKLPREVFRDVLDDFLPWAETGVRLQTIQQDKDRSLAVLQERNLAVASIRYHRIRHPESPHNDADGIIIQKHTLSRQSKL